jgi:hypothetical protein
MVSFQTKNPNLGNLWRTLDWKKLIFFGHLKYFTAIWYILWPFGTFYDHLVHFVFIWYIFSGTEKNLATLVTNVSQWSTEMCKLPFKYIFGAGQYTPLHKSNKQCIWSEFTPGLPDFFLVKQTKPWENMPNDHKIYQMTIRYTKWPKIFQTTIKYINIFHSKAL